MIDYVTIKINFPNGMTASDFSMRYILADTLEERDIGRVINEGTGDRYMEISVKLKEGKALEDITSLLRSLNLFNQAELF